MRFLARLRISLPRMLHAKSPTVCHPEFSTTLKVCFWLLGDTDKGLLAAERDTGNKSVPFLVDVHLIGNQTARSPPRTDEVLEDIVALQRQAIRVITDNDLRLNAGFLECRVAECGQSGEHLRYSVYVFIDRLGGLPIPA